MSGEQSHKREMAAAVRGDFARLRQRGVSTTLGVPAADEDPPRVTGAPDAAERGSTERAETGAERQVAEADARRRSLARRLFGRP